CVSLCVCRSLSFATSPGPFQGACRAEAAAHGCDGRAAVGERARVRRRAAHDRGGARGRIGYLPPVRRAHAIAVVLLLACDAPADSNVERAPEPERAVAPDALFPLAIGDRWREQIG